jgi:hypothetical protein
MGLAGQVTAARDPNRFCTSPIRQILSLETPLRGDGKHFFALCDQMPYCEALYYSRHPEQYVLLPSFGLNSNLRRFRTVPWRQ